MKKLAPFEKHSCKKLLKNTDSIWLFILDNKIFYTSLHSYINPCKVCARKGRKMFQEIKPNPNSETALQNKTGETPLNHFTLIVGPLSKPWTKPHVWRCWAGTWHSTLVVFSKLMKESWVEPTWSPNPWKCNKSLVLKKPDLWIS